MLARAMAQADKILAIARLLDGVEDRLLDLQNSSRIALADANAALEILRKAHIREDEIIVSDSYQSAVYLSFVAILKLKRLSTQINCN